MNVKFVLCSRNSIWFLAFPDRQKVDFQGKAVIHRRWCRKPENYTCAKTVGDNIHLILESGITVATTQTKKDRKRRTGKRPPSDKTAARQ